MKDESYCTYVCENHNNVMVQKYNANYNADSIWLLNFPYIIIMRLKENKMFLYKGGFLIMDSFIDRNLTPENFEQKLKTYLIFQ